MSCYAPLRAFRTATGDVVFQELARYDIVGSIELPCGLCLGCHMRRASDWELRIMHEASQWQENCFVTLTYARDCLPPDGGLCHRDFQLFMKRLRKYAATTGCAGPVVGAVQHSLDNLLFGPRFYMCGEYGPLNLRPHYHACLFNWSFSDLVEAGKSGAGAVYFDSPLLSRLWSLGRVSVQPLTVETAGYCARYCVKALEDERLMSYVRDGGVIVPREYCAMSLKPGIGAAWFDRFSRDVFPRDFVVADGAKRRPPRFYDRRAKRADPVGFEQIEFARAERARAGIADSTPERLAVRAVVHAARLRNHLRGDL